MWRRPDSNRRPPGCKPGALPTELRPRTELRSRVSRLRLVGLTGFEPVTSRLSGGRSNQLSYRPMPKESAAPTRACCGSCRVDRQANTCGALFAGMSMLALDGPRARHRAVLTELGDEEEGDPVHSCSHSYSPPGRSPTEHHPKAESMQNRIQVSNSSVGKEVIQPQVPLRLPCYDLVPITELAFGAALPKVRHSDFEHSPLSWLDGRCVQGSGTYSPRHG